MAQAPPAWEAVISPILQKECTGMGIGQQLCPSIHQVYKQRPEA